MDQQRENIPVGNYYRLFGLTSLVGKILLPLVTVWIIKYKNGFGWASDALLQFNWHPFLMVLGLIFFYSQSILVYRTGRYFISKKNLKYVHGAIHLVAFIVAVVGLQAVYDSHNRRSMANLYSLHSWIGLSTVIIFAAQLLSGFVAFLYPGLPGPVKKTLMPLHVFLGLIGFVMAIISTISGLTEVAMWTNGYSDLPPEAYVINFIGLSAVVYGALTIYMVIKPEFKRIPSAED